MRKCLSALILAKPRYNSKGILKTYKLYILYNVLVSCELHFFILLSVYIYILLHLCVAKYKATIPHLIIHVYILFHVARMQTKFCERFLHLVKT